MRGSVKYDIPEQPASYETSLSSNINAAMFIAIRGCEKRGFK
jgi:hypothetical protein